MGVTAANNNRGAAGGVQRIATLAGVSPATVSRVINGKPYVRAELREAVEKVIREHGLHLNACARSLKSRKTRRLAVITPRPAEYIFENPFFGAILGGIGSVAEPAGYSLTLVTSASSEALYEANRNRSCDGVIFIGFKKGVPEPRSLKGAVVPVVTIPRPGPRYQLPFVGFDDEGGAYQAVRHLVEQHHTRIALVNGPRNSIYSINRLLGYRRALRDFELPVEPSLMVSGGFSLDRTQEATNRLMDLQEPPTAILVTSDYMATSVLEALSLLGVSVPGDVAVVGFGNTPICKLVRPTLTSVDNQLREVGVQAASLVIRLAQGEPVSSTQVLLPTKLVVRDSSVRPKASSRSAPVTGGLTLSRA